MRELIVSIVLTPSLVWSAPHGFVARPLTPDSQIMILEPRGSADYGPDVPVSGASGLSPATEACSLLTSFSLNEEFMAAWTVSSAHTTELYAGSYRFTIDSLLNRDVDTLPIPHGLTWVAEDLDLDGSLDLVLQRGDGSNGFLDIVSTSTWSTRQRITFPGMNVVMYAQTLQLDPDEYPEIYITPQGLEGVSAYALLDYDPVADSFLIIDFLTEPIESAGRSAVADFDNDGRFEFVRINENGIGIHEWTGSAIVDKGQVFTSLPTMHARSAICCRPRPGGVTYLLIGYSESLSNGYNFHHDLLEPTGDDAFQVDTAIQYWGASGAGALAGAMDSDCDGLDELTLFFSLSAWDPIRHEVWDWDQSTLSFHTTCSWTALSGSLEIWHEVDLNWDGSTDWVAVNPVRRLWAVSGGPCLSCGAPGICSPPPMECVCLCHTDPACDGATDVVDVVKTIDVAFRGSPEQNDTAPLCHAIQTDLDCNGVTDISDAIRMINVAFRGANKATEFCDPCL